MNPINHYNEGDDNNDEPNEQSLVNGHLFPALSWK